MIKNTRIIIPIPKVRNTKVKIEIKGVDVTSRVVESSWVKPVTTGLGTFNLNLSNAKGQFSGNYNPGDVVKFYADNTDNTTLQFWGRIDFTKDDISANGQFLNIEGRHRSFLLNESFVNHTATNTATSTILKDIIDKLPASYGFTYTNVITDTTLMSVEWNYKPFWDCVEELTNKAKFDCYVEDDLDIHYFPENSISNEGDAVSEGDNFLKAKDSGTDKYYEKTRVIAIGQDTSGLPIVYTAISSGEGTEIKEVFINDTSANTFDKVKDLAEAKLIEVTNKQRQQNITSYGLETVKPGDNIWVIIPRQKIANQYKLVKITHRFGMKVGGWRTVSIFEEPERGIASTVKNLNQTSQQIRDASNVNKLNFSYNFGFDEDSGTHEDTEITQGVLKTTTGNETGTWISPTRTLNSNVSKVEMRATGDRLTGVRFYYSVNGGTVWHQLVNLNQSYDAIVDGNFLAIKVIFISSTAQVDSLALLYS